MNGFSVIMPGGEHTHFAAGNITQIWVVNDGTDKYTVAFFSVHNIRGDFGGGFTLEAANEFASDIATMAGIGADWVDGHMVPDARDHLDR